MRNHVDTYTVSLTFQFFSRVCMRFRARHLSRTDDKHKAEGTEGEAESRLLRKLLRNQNRLIDSIRLMDADRDGVISTDEFRAAIVAMNIGLTDRQVENLIRSTDADNDGELDMQVSPTLLRRKLTATLSKGCSHASVPGATDNTQQ